MRGLYYKIRWYLPRSAFLGQEMWDETVFYYTEDEDKDLVFWDLNYRYGISTGEI